MIATIFLALMFLVSTGCILAGWSVKNNGLAAGGAAGVVVSLLLFFFACFTPVGTSDVGVETAFGKTLGDLQPGFHLTWPWVNVTNWDHSVQVISYGRNTNQSSPDHCLLVRIGNQQSACLTLTFAYQVRPAASDALFVAYRGDQNRMHDFLVTRTLDSVINSDLETYSPIAAAATGKTSAEALSPYARKIESDMRHLVGASIVIGAHALVMPYVAYDKSTTEHINAYQAQLYKTAVARQAITTASDLAQANRILAASVSNDPNVITYQCMVRVAEQMISQGMNPAGFSCWPGSGSSAVVVTPRR